MKIKSVGRTEVVISYDDGERAPWRWLSKMMDDDDVDVVRVPPMRDRIQAPGFNEVSCLLTEFEVTKAHLALLRCSYTTWHRTAFGAPGVDTKRPYGDSDVITTLAHILQIKGTEDEWGDVEYRTDQYDLMYRMHRETQVVLQIGIDTGSFKAGLYRRSSPYAARWEKA